MTRSVLPVPASDFIGLEGFIHLAAAGESPVLATQPEVFAQYARDKAGGLAGIRRIYARVEAARRDVAALLGVTPSEIGFALNVAQAMSSIARTMDCDDGNVVFAQWDFSSTTYPWLTGTRLKPRLLTDQNYLVDMTRLAELVDRNTRAIVISLVSYYTGERVDLTELRRVVDEVGAALIVDASHALGAVQFDATLADFVLSCGYKWMLGAHGAATAYCNANRQPGWLPRESGWRSTREVRAAVRGLEIVQEVDGRRFELGNPAILSVLLTGQGVRYLNGVGIGNVDLYLSELTGQIIERLDHLGIDLLTPHEDGRRAGIVAFNVADSEGWQERLDAAGVVAWATEGRVRLSPHIYTSPADISKALDVITRLAGA